MASRRISPGTFELASCPSASKKVQLLKCSPILDEPDGAFHSSEQLEFEVFEAILLDFQGEASFPDSPMHRRQSLEAFFEDAGEYHPFVRVYRACLSPESREDSVIPSPPPPSPARKLQAVCKVERALLGAGRGCVMEAASSPSRSWTSIC